MAAAMVKVCAAYNGVAKITKALPIYTRMMLKVVVDYMTSDLLSAMSTCCPSGQTDETLFLFNSAMTDTNSPGLDNPGGGSLGDVNSGSTRIGETPLQRGLYNGTVNSMIDAGNNDAAPNALTLAEERRMK
jgi:hypothetical protein